MSQVNVKQFIQSAERFIGTGKLELALDQLSLAQKLEPENKYIKAIMDRVESLKTRHASNIGSMEALLGDASLATLNGPDPLQTTRNLQAQIRQLTTIAENFLEQGSCENAFDSLMKAYLLDPVSPYVIACERTVLPAWESSRANRPHITAQSNHRDHPLTSTLGRSLNMLADNNGVPPVKKELNRESPGADHSKRLEFLKQQKEMQRLERERAQWREASRPPRVFGEQDIPPATHTSNGNEPPPEPQGGFFSRLMRGRLLK